MAPFGKFESVPRQRGYNTAYLSNVIVLVIVLLITSGNVAFAGQDYPPPSTGTDADFYVSWNDGDDSNPGTFDQPFKTPDRAVGILKSMPDPSGKIVLIRGGTYRLRDHDGNRLFLTDLHGSMGAPIEIRGYPGETVILDAFLEEFDPLAVPFKMVCGWGGISFNNSRHLLVENFVVRGRATCNIGLIDSDYITVRYVEAYRSNGRGFFTGGSFHDLTIECCKFYEQIYGNSTSHGIYISGGVWDPDLPPIRNVKIRYTECYYNGRHGIQFNGRMENITVEHCNLHHNILGGLSLIGVRNVDVSNNLIYKNNKQGVILYTYFDDSYWNKEDPDSLAHWKATHWTVEDVLIRNNTIFMDDGPWYDDEWIGYDPKWHGAIYMVDTSGLLPPFDDILIAHNIIYNHSEMIINLANPEFFLGVSGFYNLFLSADSPEALAAGQSFHFEHLQNSHPYLWHDNVLGADPEFLHLTPTLLADQTHQTIDFSKYPFSNFPDDFWLDPESPAWPINAGAFLAEYDSIQIETDTTSAQTIPPGYGQDIVKVLLAPGVNPVMLFWFALYFNPTLICLEEDSSLAQSMRMSFRNSGQKHLSVAALNTDNVPAELEIKLVSSNGPIEYTSAFGVIFDEAFNYRVMYDMNLANDLLQCTMGKNSMGVFIVDYK